MGFFLALAINQKQPNIVLEVIQQNPIKSGRTTIQSIRVQAFAEIGRFNNVIKILGYQAKKDADLVNSKVVFQETVSVAFDNLNTFNNSSRFIAGHS